MSNRDYILANLQKIELAYKKENKKDFTFGGVRWKELTEDYVINEYGDIISFKAKHPRLLKNDNPDDHGYIRQKIVFKEKKQKYWRNHQLVAMVFLNHKPIGNTSVVVDHIDRNKLNNHISNLRIVTPAENARNRSKDNHSTNTSNVCWCKKYRKLSAYVEKNGKRYHLGYFQSEQEAVPWIENAIKNMQNGSPILSKKRTPQVASLGVVLTANGRFKVSFYHNKKHLSISSFLTEKDAYNAFLKAKDNLANGRHFKDGIYIEKQ